MAHWPEKNFYVCHPRCARYRHHVINFRRPESKAHLSFVLQLRLPFLTPFFTFPHTFLYGSSHLFLSLLTPFFIAPHTFLYRSSHLSLSPLSLFFLVYILSFALFIAIKLMKPFWAKRSSVILWNNFLESTRITLKNRQVYYIHQVGKVFVR